MKPSHNGIEGKYSKGSFLYFPRRTLFEYKLLEVC
jgi:hypothetical protein